MMKVEGRKKESRKCSKGGRFILVVTKVVVDQESDVE